MSRILIVGGAGFIGSRLCLRLIGMGHEVRVLDNFTTGRHQNLAGIEREIDVLTGDMLDKDLVATSLRGVDSVVLLAAVTSVARSVTDPVGTTTTNIGGTLVVLENARNANVGRFVFASSAAVYGNSPELHKSERLIPKPISPYGVAKLAGEHYCRVFRELFDLPSVSLRFFNVFGPHQNLQSNYASAVPRFMRTISDGSQPTVYGSGQQTRDFVYVENIVDALVLSLMREDPGPGPFNIGTGRSTSVLDLVHMIMKVAGRTVEVNFADPRQGDIPASQADISLATATLSYEPRISIEDGLALMAKWLDEDAETAGESRNEAPLPRSNET